MPLALRLLRHPHGSLVNAVEHPGTAGAVLVVLLSGLASLGLDAAAARIAPSRFASPALATFLVIPVLLLGFWGLSGWLIDSGARLMAVGGQRRRILNVTGHCFGVLAGYGLVGVLQALAIRLGGGDAGMRAVGLLGFGVIAWFVTLLGVAISAVYGVEPPGALALALLPFAALSAAVLLFIVLVSALHAAGLI